MLTVHGEQVPVPADFGYDERDPAPRYRRRPRQGRREARREPSDAVEYCVGACLWDLFDERQEDEDRGRDADRISLTFQEIFSVYSPDLQVLTDGVVIQSIHEYLDRLKRLFPDRRALHAEIDQVRRRNVG